MGKWMEEYGETLLAGLAGCMILALVLTTGILSVIGIRIKLKENSNMQYQDMDAFSGLCQREKPEIIYDTDRHWYVGEVISIDEAFWGEDADGKQLSVKVKAITDEEGISCMDVYEEGMHQVSFQQAGIYLFELKVQDEEKLCTTAQIAVPVDNGKVSQ